METLLEVDVSLMDIGETGNEGFKKSINLSGESSVAKGDGVNLGVFISILQKIFCGGTHLAASVQNSRVDQLFVSQFFKANHD